MKILFVMPKVGAWATHGQHRAPNQLYAHWAAYARSKGYEDVEVLDCRATDIALEQMVATIKEKQPDVVVLGDMLHSYGGFAIIHYFCNWWLCIW